LSSRAFTRPFADVLLPGHDVWVADDGMVLRQDESLGVPRRGAARTRPSGASDRVVCPFKGLASFDTGDAEYFCGRDRVIQDHHRIVRHTFQQLV